MKGPTINNITVYVCTVSVCASVTCGTDCMGSHTSEEMATGGKGTATVKGLTINPFSYVHACSAQD